jgi:hypothetical protein
LTDPIACAAEKAEADEQAGNLLADLERRQDDVLAQLDELDRRVSDLLRGLGVTLIEDAEAFQCVDESDDATEVAVGFAKLPQGDAKARNSTRTKAAFNESSSWDQKSRAA